MSYLDRATYVDRERSWRDQAARLPAGSERDACNVLADGYAHLIRLLERLEAERTVLVELPTPSTPDVR